MKPLIEVVDGNLVDLGDDVELSLVGQVKVHELQVLSPELRVLLINWQGGTYFLIDFLSWTEILSTNMVLNIEIPLVTSQQSADSFMKRQKELVVFDLRKRFSQSPLSVKGQEYQNLLGRIVEKFF